MDLATIKKRESLNKQLAPLQQQLIARRQNAMSIKAAGALSEFHAYFQQHEFEVRKPSPDRVTATYGSATFVLEYEGKVNTFNLTTVEGATVQLRLVDKRYKGPTVAMTMHTREPDPIRQAEADIAEAQAQLSQAAPDFDYLLVDQNQSQSRPSVTTFPDFAAVLAKFCP